MPRDFKVYLDDILEAARKIHLYLGDLSFEGFCGDSKTAEDVIETLTFIQVAPLEFGLRRSPGM